MAGENSGLRVTLEFGGGAELLFDKIKKQQVTLPEKDKSWTIRSLLVWIKDNLLKERPELFLQGDNVRPGILVLVNDADWELLAWNFMVNNPMYFMRLWYLVIYVILMSVLVFVIGSNVDKETIVVFRKALS